MSPFHPDLAILVSRSFTVAWFGTRRRKLGFRPVCSLRPIHGFTGEIESRYVLVTTNTRDD